MLQVDEIWKKRPKDQQKLQINYLDIYKFRKMKCFKKERDQES